MDYLITKNIITLHPDHNDEDTDGDGINDGVEVLTKDVKSTNF